MTTTHDEYLELAAAGFDFHLSPAERTSLDTHLSGCIPCRRRVAALAADQRAIGQLPAYALSPAGVARVRKRSGTASRSSISAMRLIAIAAMLALLAGAAITVGSAMLRRDRDLNLIAVVPSPIVPSPIVPSPIVPSPTTSVPPAPTGVTPSGGYAANTIVEVVVTDLRVRTAPTVDDTKSAKLEPLLGTGTQLRVIEGPVNADGYDWYLVQAIGLPHRGWVAAADHDGAPWVEDLAIAASPTPSFSAEEAALVAGLRRDAAVRCAPRRSQLPALAIAGVECRVSDQLVARVGVYRFRDAQDAATTYLERLASYGIDPTMGDCGAGTDGDAAWAPGDGSASADGTTIQFGGTGPWAVGRSGCYVDENGVANVRATCGATYVGVLGAAADLAALRAWAWSAPGGPVGTGAPPGICASGS